MRGSHKKKGGFKSHSHLNSHLKFLKKENIELKPLTSNNPSATPNPSIADDNDSQIQPAEDMDTPPFAIGHNLVVKYRDGSLRLAKIIERRKKGGLAVNNSATNADATAESELDWHYYIHYHDFNRRMDEWVDHSRIVLYPSKAADYRSQQELQDGQRGNESTTEDESLSDSQLTKRIRFSKTNSVRVDESLYEDDVDSSVGGDFTTVAELEHDEHEGLDEASVLEHEEVTKVKNFLYVQLGRHIMECWYFSPLPKEFHMNPPVECIYFCEFSFRFFKTKDELNRFQANPLLNRYPPGNEIYRDSELSMFEVDGAVEKVYCQNLCYFAKLFLDHKTLYWDVDPFLFYVLCSYDDRGYHPVGYFSKEK
jgi:histone acetyltransferase MYST1